MRRILLPLLSVAALALAAGGCTPEVTCGRECNPSGTDGGTARDAAPPVADLFDPRAGEVISIVVMPSTATISVVDGAQATQAFQAIATLKDGSTQTVPALFTVPDEHLGAISPSGLYTASGIGGGSVVVSATLVGAADALLTATAQLTIRSSTTVVGTGVTQANVAAFGGGAGAPDPSNEAHVLYPLDGALVPNNVAPPDVQWERGASGDVFRVSLTKPDATVTAYVLHTGASFTYDWPVDATAWRTILESDPDAAATLTVDRLTASTGKVVTGSPQQLRFAHGSVFGVVYYWNLSSGAMEKIDAVAATASNLIPNGPTPSSTGVQPQMIPSDDHCVACHSISQNGRYLSAELWGGGQPSAVFDLTQDLSKNPAPTQFPVAANVAWLFSSFNPDASRLVVNQGNALAMIDPMAGASVSATGLPGQMSAHPTWSPDGKTIGYIANANGGWAVDYDSGDLALLPSTGQDAFGAPTVIHVGSSLSGAPEAGAADSHPTWSPDSAYLAFGHGQHSRSRVTSSPPAPTDGPRPGALYLVAAKAGAAPVRLDAAVGGSADSYWPTFSPFTTAEPSGHHLFWLAFYSPRDYGNAQVGTRGTGRRQLWVTAIDPAATGDPSHVPYWLPGQDVSSLNMAAQWAPLACRQNGNACAVSTDCCSGTCDPASHTCTPPPTNMCRTSGKSCSGDADCCQSPTGLVCIGNVCTLPPA